MEEKKWAFLIGIDKYNELSSFNYCSRHVEELKRILIEKGEYKEENIKTLVCEDDKLVIRSDIIREFARFLWEKEGGYNHTFVIYYIGHGVYLDTLYLLTSDSLVDARNPLRIVETGLSINWFEKEMSRFDSQAWNVFMFVDACQIGMLQSHGEDDEDINKEESKKLLASLPSGISYFYSCKPKHKGYQFKEKDEINSIFSSALIESLRTLPKPISFGDIVKQVKERVHVLSSKYDKPYQYPFATADVHAYRQYIMGSSKDKKNQ